MKELFHQLDLTRTTIRMVSVAGPVELADPCSSGWGAVVRHLVAGIHRTFNVPFLISGNARLHLRIIIFLMSLMFLGHVLFLTVPYSVNLSSVYVHTLCQSTCVCVAA